MAWPDISRRIWSYIIAKIGVFSNIEPSRLELGSNSLCLTEIDIDAEKIPIPGISITQFSLDKLQMGISSSGLSLNGNGIKIHAKVDTLESPDIAISMFLESTKADLAELAHTEDANIDSKSSNYFTAKLADLVISQMSARFSDVNIELSIAQNTSLHLNISEVFMTSKFCVEFESITVTKIDCFSDEDADDGSESGSDEEDLMSKSIYLDACSSLRGLGNAKPESRIESRTSLAAIIEGIIFTYRLDPMSYHVDIENAKFDGLITCELLVLTLNTLFSRKSETRASDCSSEVATSSFNINCFDIYEALDDEALRAVSLKNIAYSESALTVGSLEIPGILMASPFLSAQLSDPLKISILVPISAYISSEMLVRLKKLASQLSTIFEELQPPPDTEPTPFITELSDLRIAIGSNSTVVILPLSGSEKGITLREVIARIDDTQLALSDITIDYQGCLLVESLRLNLESSFYDKFNKFMDLFAQGDEKTSGNFSNQDQSFPHLSDSRLEIHHFEIINKTAKTDCAGSLAFRVCSRDSRLKLNLKGAINKSEFQFEFLATSQNRFRKSEAVLRFQHLRLDLNQFKFDRDGKREPENSNVDFFVAFPAVTSLIEFDDDIYLAVDETMVIIHADNSKLKVSSKGLSLHFPRLYGDIEDPSEICRRITLLKVKDLTANYYTETKIDAGVVALMSCADSYSYVSKLIEKLTPSAQAKEMLGESEIFVDTFRDVEDEVFVALNLPSVLQAHLTHGKETDIEIEANYLDREQKFRRKLNASEGILPSPTTWDSVSTVNVSRFQWQIFDGFDFKRTRDRICKAIDEVTQVAANIEESSDSSSESAVVGDFMYGSVLIAAQTSKATTLHADVVKELGSNANLERSVDPKVVATCRKVQFSRKSRIPQKRNEVASMTSLTVREGLINDLVSTSRFNFVLWPSKDRKRRDFLTFSESYIETAGSPEAKLEIELRPVHLSFDQDTVEFLARFFQFTDLAGEDIGDKVKPKEAETSTREQMSFFRRLKFGGLAIIIDYTPKKLDYRSLRSGMATELLNVFEVKGAKLKLAPAIFYGINGWSEAWPTLLDFWMPDIKENQLLGLVGGLAPIRKAVKVGKGVNKRTIAPIKQREISKGAGIIVRRTLDEILRIATSWLDSTDEAFGAE